MPAPAATRLDEPSPGDFWRWVWDSVRPVLGYVFVGLGLLALLIGWYGVSGSAIVAKQLPYVVSGGLLGVALVVLGARFLLLQDLHRDSGRLDRLETMVLELHAVLLSRPDAPAKPLLNGHTPSQPAAELSSYVALPGGTTYHLPDCAMLAGKERATAVKPATAARRGLSPCPLCEPAVVSV